MNYYLSKGLMFKCNSKSIPSNVTSTILHIL